MRRFSLEGKLTALLMLCSVLAVAVSVAAITLIESLWHAALLAATVMLVPATMLARLVVRPVEKLVRALSGSVVAFRDGDFSFSIRANRGDEIGDLVALHNELGVVLRVPSLSVRGALA
ncbi:MAG: HAMP domain-containing protein [Dokdonella sp.]